MADGDIVPSRSVPDGPTMRDFAYKVGEAATNLIPLWGGPLAVLLGTILTPPLEKRRLEFLADLAARVDELGRDVEAFKADNLAENEQFLSGAITAAQLADKTHSRERRTMLRNAALNSASTPLDDETFLLLFRLVDELLPSEVRVLRFLNDPRRWDIEAGRGESRAVDANGAALFSHVGGQSPYETKRIWDRLAILRLANSAPTMDEAITFRRIYRGFTTPLGRRFLGFITDPVEP